MRPKMHALLLDASINSGLTVRLNIYQVRHALQNIHLAASQVIVVSSIPAGLTASAFPPPRENTLLASPPHPQPVLPKSKNSTASTQSAEASNSSHALLLDASINSGLTVRLNIYQVGHARCNMQQQQQQQRSSSTSSSSRTTQAVGT
jgi:hypothetical protein